MESLRLPVIDQGQAEAAPRELKRSVWAAANLLRAGGLNTLETIEHLTLALFLKLLSKRGHGGIAEIDRIAEGLPNRDVVGECLTQQAPSLYLVDEALPA